jgi:hypothetical protein
MPDGTDPTSPDAATGSTGVGPDAQQSICEQATMHADLTFIQDNVFSATCARSTCHTSTNQAGGLVLEQGMAHDNLVGKASTQHAGWMRVVAGQPDMSYLLVAIGGADGPDRGTMPWAMPMLCQEKIEAIRRWIAAGANP